MSCAFQAPSISRQSVPIDHMQAMLSSTVMNRIASGKQLGDTLAFATIPVLSKL